MRTKWNGMLVCAVMAATVVPGWAQKKEPQQRLLDVMKVSARGDSSQALVSPVMGAVHDVNCDVVIIGAGMGGVSAALATAENHHSVCMTEPTMWVGGQATSQGVSAFDDNKWINTTGGTARHGADQPA